MKEIAELHTNDIKKFLEIEKCYHLYDRQINGINYWIYSRFMLWEGIQKSIYGLGVSQREKNNSIWEKIRRIIQLFYHSFIKPQKLKKEIDIFFLCHPRRILNEGYYECCYTTDLALEYENSITGERPYLAKHERPIKEKNLFYLDRIIVLGNLNYYFYKLFRKGKYKNLRQRVKMDLEEALLEINAIWKVDLDGDWIIDLIVKKFLICMKKREQYERLLKKIQPQIIVEVVSYSMDCMILNELGKKYGIPTIELQHGVMGNGHIAYNYNSEKRIRQFPDYEFLFSDYWKQTTALPVDENHIRIVGYPYFDKQVKRYPGRKQEKKSVIFISQGTIGDALSRFAVELAVHLDTTKWRIIYKLHPGEFESWEWDYPWLKESEIEVEGKGGKNVYELFSICDIQIGVYSTALFEGLGFGLKTLIYKIYHRAEMFNELCDMGYAEFVFNIEECMDKLASLSADKRDCFWKKNAFINVKKEINEILNTVNNAEKEV